MTKKYFIRPNEVNDAFGAVMFCAHISYLQLVHK